MEEKRSDTMRKKMRLWAVRTLLALRIKEGGTVILSSSPRSGSTWLGNILGCTPDACVLFEPLHLKRVPAAQQAGFDWRTYRPAGESWPEGRDFLRRVFRGRIVNEWTAREMTASQARKARLMIVKFVRANRMLPWICREFQVRATIFLIRHPCAVIASQMKSKDWSGAARPGVPAFLDELPSFKAAIAGTQGTEEHLAAAWALDQMPVLLHDHPHPWVTITYEELFLRPAETIEKIRTACGLPIDLKAAMARIKKSSSVTYKSGISGISGWRNQLSDNQVSRILRTVHALGLTFYSEDLEPDYELLSSPKLGEMIRGAGRPPDAVEKN